MLKTAKEMNKVAGEVRNARIAKARAEAETYVNDVIALAIEKKANDGSYNMTCYMGKTDVSMATVAEILADAGYDVKRGTEVLTISW